MATRHATRHSTLSEVAQLVIRYEQQLETHKAGFSAVETALTAIQSQYGTVFTDLDQAAGADPNNTGLAAAKHTKDLLNADIEALKTRASTLNNAAILAEV